MFCVPHDGLNNGRLNTAFGHQCGRRGRHSWGACFSHPERSCARLKCFLNVILDACFNSEKQNKYLGKCRHRNNKQHRYGITKPVGHNSSEPDKFSLLQNVFLIFVHWMPDLLPHRNRLKPWSFSLFDKKENGCNRPERIARNRSVIFTAKRHRSYPAASTCIPQKDFPGCFLFVPRTGGR